MNGDEKSVKNLSKLPLKIFGNEVFLFIFNSLKLF